MKKILLMLGTLAILLTGCGSSGGDSGNPVADAVTEPTIETHGVEYFCTGLKKLTRIGQEDNNKDIVIGMENRFSDGSWEWVNYHNGKLDSKYVRNSSSNKLDDFTYDYDYGIRYSSIDDSVEYEEFKTYDKGNIIKQIVTKRPNQPDEIENFTKVVNQEYKVVLESNLGSKREYTFDLNKNIVSIRSDRTDGTTYIRKFNQFGIVIYTNYIQASSNSINEYKYIDNYVIGVNGNGKETSKREFIINNGKIINAYLYNKDNNDKWVLYAKDIYEY